MDHRADRPEPDFLALVKRHERGKLKLYVGSAAGVGKTYRMINEAHDLRRRNTDVVIGFVETHGRVDTDAQLRDLEIVPRQRIEYRGVSLEEMDVGAVIARRPEVAVVDELAHSNVPGVQHRKRWEDVMQLLDEGINVISAVNVQHVESLNDVVASMLGVTVRETVPDWVVASADQVVNLDISSEDLRQRLREGKIYKPDRIDAALRNFFTDENLTTLRELALREVAGAVDRSREEIVRRETGEVPSTAPRTVERVLVAMSSNPPYTAALLRKASRIAGRLNSDWYCVYVQTRDERADRIDSTVQRTLVANIQLAQSMGAEVVKLEGDDVAAALCRFAVKKGVTLLIVGQSKRSRLHHLTKGSVVERLVNNTAGLDVLVVSFDSATPIKTQRSDRTVEPSRPFVAEPTTATVSVERDIARPQSAVEHSVGSHDYARLLASVADASTQRLEEVRLALHILLENRFGDLNENQEEILGAARSAAESVDADMLSVRQIAELDLGERPLRRDRMKPADIIDAVRPLLVVAADAAGATLEIDVAPLLPTVVGDRAQFQDALVTILHSALATAERNTHARIDVDRDGACIRIVARGVGTAPTSVRSAVAVRVVQAHDGSVERLGDTITIALPIERIVR